MQQNRGFARLETGPGRVGLESLLTEIGKLELLRSLALPTDLLRGVHPEQIKRFRRRTAIETAWELRRHPRRLRFDCAADAAYLIRFRKELLQARVDVVIAQLHHALDCGAQRLRLKAHDGARIGEATRSVWLDASSAVDHR